MNKSKLEQIELATISLPRDFVIHTLILSIRIIVVGTYTADPLLRIFKETCLLHNGG